MLLAAPAPRAVHGLILDAEEPSVREGQRRAAAKLERVTLLEREQAVLYVAARDGRRERLVLRGGQFWRRRSAERRHAVKRTIVWRSPFGAEIERRYHDELAAGAAVRWEQRSVEAAQSAARLHYGGSDHRAQRRAALAALEEEQRAQALVVDRDANPLEPVVPASVVSDADHERWLLAASIAEDRTAGAGAGAGAAWDVACALYESLGINPLRAAAASTRAARRARSKAQRFRDGRGATPQ